MLVQVCITSFGILSGDMHLYVYIPTYIHTYMTLVVVHLLHACTYVPLSMKHQRVPVCSDVHMYVLQGITRCQLSVGV